MDRVLGGSYGAKILNQDIYAVSATQKHRLGTRVRRGDRVFRYAKATATMTVNHLLMHSTYHQDIMYAAIPTANIIGDNQIHVTVGAADGIANDGVFAEHAIEGGSLVIFYAPAVLNNGVVANFNILDNNAAVSGGDMTITLDGELPRATVVGTSIIEAMGNPYLVDNANPGGLRWFAGQAMRLLSTTYPYGWIQTWGPTWLAPQTRVGDAANQGAVIARHDGSLDVQDESGYGNAQIVGHVMTYSQAGGQAAPFVFLTIAA